MIFAGWMIGGMAAEGAVSSSNDAKPGADPEHNVRNDAQGANTSSMVLDATLESASLEWTIETTANGVKGTFRVKTTVTATLAREASVDPAGSKVAADARFAYVAPGEKDKAVTVSLEARSRRGPTSSSTHARAAAPGTSPSAAPSRTRPSRSPSRVPVVSIARPTRSTAPGCLMSSTGSRAFSSRADIEPILAEG